MHFLNVKPFTEEELVVLAEELDTHAELLKNVDTELEGITEEALGALDTLDS